MRHIDFCHPLPAAKELGLLHIENLFWIGFVGGALCLLFALIQWRRILSLSEGGTLALGLSGALHKGTRTYLKWQLLLSGIAIALCFAFLAVLVYLRLLNRMSSLAFLSGSLCGLLVGSCGALLTAVTGPRAAQAAGERLDRGVDAAFRAGAVIGFLSVGLALTHLTGWIYILRPYMGYDPGAIARTLLFFGLGSALSALLFRMGAVFARSAGMSAEIMDREMGLPPDSPQNPVTVADRMGHGTLAAGNAGDLYCSYENILFAALFLGSGAFTGQDMTWNAMLLPLTVAVAGALAGLIGFLTIRPQERGDRYSLPWHLRFSGLISALLTAAATVPITYFLTGSWQMCLPVLIGLSLGFFSNLAGEYVTADTYRPARSLAETAETGAAAIVTGALGLGALGAALPSLLTAAALATAFCLAGGLTEPFKGMYGLALAGTGMLSISGISLAAAFCGPTGNCAADVASLIDADEVPRRRADNLAAVGASAANGGQCTATVSTALSGFVLLVCLSQILGQAGPEPSLLLGAFGGILALFLFLGLLLLAVRSSAKVTLSQARRQFQDYDGLLEGFESPDYALCVTQCATSSLVGFLPSLLVALIAPPTAGLLLGPQGLLGFLVCALVLGVTLSLLFSLSSGVLGGARRYVESGRRGGRGSDSHRAALTAERAIASMGHVAGPALLSFAKLSLTLALLCVSLVLTYNLPGLLG